MDMEKVKGFQKTETLTAAQYCSCILPLQTAAPTGPTLLWILASPKNTALSSKVQAALQVHEELLKEDTAHTYMLQSSGKSYHLRTARSVLNYYKYWFFSI